MEVEMKKSKVTSYLGIVLLVSLIATTGCASKKYVLGEVAALDQKLEGVESTVEENQKRLKEHDERLSSLGSLISQQESAMSQQESEFEGKIEEVKKLAQGKLILQAVIQSDVAKFETDSYELSDEAKMILDEFVQKLVAEDRGVYLEIQGHTDDRGPDAWNLLLGKKRAEAVMDYLHKQYNIPLHRMDVITYGSSNPIADNSTREGRAQNRRVEVLVYE
jgi:outer membrane protein OmpA-like peptidoglycan-associated protein